MIIKSKYKTHCRRCYGSIYKGQEVEWLPEKKTVRHIDCKPNHTRNVKPPKRKVKFIS